MDFSKVDVKKAVEEAFTIVIKHPVTGEDTDCSVDVLGVGCAKWKAAEKKIDKVRADALKRGKVPDEDEIEELHRKALIDCTVGWKNVFVGDEEIPFTPANAERMYQEYPVLTTQVLEGVFNIKDRLEKN